MDITFTQNENCQFLNERGNIAMFEKWSGQIQNGVRTV